MPNPQNPLLARARGTGSVMGEEAGAVQRLRLRTKGELPNFARMCLSATS